jgi:hypothetical protein
VYRVVDVCGSRDWKVPLWEVGGEIKDVLFCILIAIIVGRAVSQRIAATNLTLLTSRRIMHCAESVVALASWHPFCQVTQRFLGRHVVIIRSIFRP